MKHHEKHYIDVEMSGGETLDYVEGIVRRGALAYPNDRYVMYIKSQSGKRHVVVLSGRRFSSSKEINKHFPSGQKILIIENKLYKVK